MDEEESYWTENFSYDNSAFEPYMDQLSPMARFTLAVRLWLRVSRVNAHDIVNMVQTRLVGDQDIKTTLNGIDYQLSDGSVIDVHLPVHDGDIMRDSADNNNVGLDSLAHNLAVTYPQEVLVPCAVAAGMSQEEATTFVRNLRRPHKKKRQRTA